jgi:flavin reductase (DIM6/NTAB) family NADH-FMN oxidoreductase RutF
VLIDFMRGLTYAVSIILTAGKDGSPHGATISSLISVNVDPKNEELLLVLKRKSHTISIIRENPLFTVSLLSRNQTEAAKYFSMDRDTLHLNEYLTQSKFEEKTVYFVQNPAAELVCQFSESYSRDESLIVIANVLETKIHDLSNVLTYSQRTYR